MGIFLPVVLILYFITKNREVRNWILLVASLVFYAWGEPIWILALIVLSIFDYFYGILLSKAKTPGKKKVVLIATVISNISILVFVKYLDFLISTINYLSGLSIPLREISMPLGVSFFTFHSLTYVVDVYRGAAKAQKNYAHLLLYISMFPKLILGPIVRYADIERQITDRQESVEGMKYGMFRFATGLGKKVIFANYAGTVATSLLTNGLTDLSTGAAWIGIIMYTLQIYFDFSGYSDMAIGLGKVFGFDYKENFNYPYVAKSITDFWRRWHISLSSFFRDYVYIPLGGNRKHQMLNIFLVWMLTGLWHGASWNFVLWGLYYGIFLIIEKYLRKFSIDIEKVQLINHLLIMLIVVYGWAIFYYTDMSQLVLFTKKLGGLNNNLSLSLSELSIIFSYLKIIPLMIIGATPIPAKICRGIFWPGTATGDFVRTLWTIALIGGCFVLVLGQSYSPFLYFKF
jgi:alginate O-acetyltransferase complex protein AlgI